MNFSSFYRLFFENEEMIGPVYHGGKWDGVSPIKMGKGSLGYGAYFTPDHKHAEGYAYDNGGSVYEVYLNVKNPLIISVGDKQHPCVEALVSLGMDSEKAYKFVEKIEEEKGYLGKEIMKRAVAAGYDGLIEYKNGKLLEIVVWNSRNVIVK